jgi:PIN domain nuclease of toxin-antitoxin system
LVSHSAAPASSGKPATAWACLTSGATLLPIQDAHVIESGQLPDVHQDPFDRLLIAQARVERCTAVSSDAHWDGYGIALVRP